MLLRDLSQRHTGHYSRSGDRPGPLKKFPPRIHKDAPDASDYQSSRDFCDRLLRKEVGMLPSTSPISRRSFTRLFALATAAALSPRGNAQQPTSLFDGKSLEGWLQLENNATSLAATSIKDPATFATWLTDGSDAVSVYLRTRLPESLKKDLADWSPTAANSKTVMAALAKDVQRVWLIPEPPVKGAAAVGCRD